jgi:hypothetical protein
MYVVSEKKYFPNLIPFIPLGKKKRKKKRVFEVITIHVLHIDLCKTKLKFQDLIFSTANVAELTSLSSPCVIVIIIILFLFPNSP